jgi:hypothetical protein
MSLRRIALTATLAAALSSASARADDKATAQQLFQEGKTLMAAGKVADACPKFASAAELSPTPGVRLNLGDCYDKLGRTASAWAKYDEARALAERASDAAAADLARSRLAAVKPRLSYLAVKVSPDAAAIAGLEIARDGDSVPQSSWGTSLPVDPGDHQVKATAPGRAPWATTVSVTAPGEQVVMIPVLASAAESAGAGKVPASFDQGSTPAVSGGSDAEAQPRSRLFSGVGGTQRTLAVVGAGVGVVGLGIGSYFGAQMLSKKSEYQKHQDSAGNCIDLQCQTASHDAASAGDVATVAFVAGGVLVATGAVLWLTAPRASGAAPAVALVPMSGPGGAGFGATGTW